MTKTYKTFHITIHTIQIPRPCTDIKAMTKSPFSLHLPYSIESNGYKDGRLPSASPTEASWDPFGQWDPPILCDLWPSMAVNLRAAVLRVWTLSACTEMSASCRPCFWSRSSTSNRCFPKSLDSSWTWEWEGEREKEEKVNERERERKRERGGREKGRESERSRENHRKLKENESNLISSKRCKTFVQSKARESRH